MTVIAVGSVHSAGATTVAMTLAASLADAVLVEADPHGGVLALRYGMGREPGLLTLAAFRQLSLEGILAHAQRLPGGLPAVVAPESPERCTQLLRTTGGRLSQLFSQSNANIVVDVGRLSPSSPSAGVAMAAVITLVVARARADHLVAAGEQVAALGPHAGLVLVGSGPYPTEQVAAELNCRVLGVIVSDPKAAAVLSEGGRGRVLLRSPLLRSARGLAATIDRLLVAPPRPDNVVSDNGSHARSGAQA